MLVIPRERKRREQERKLGQIRANPVMPVQPHNNGGVMPPPHHLPPMAPQSYPPPQPPPSRPEKLASLPRSAAPPPASASTPGGPAGNASLARWRFDVAEFHAVTGGVMSLQAWTL